MKKQKGMTLVETIVSFSVLLIAIAMFYGSITLSNKIISTQNEKISDYETAVNSYYLGEYSELSSTGIHSKNANYDDNLFKDIKLKKIQSNDYQREIYFYE